MIIDVHNHIGVDKDTTSQTASQLLANMNEQDIDNAFVFPFNEVKADLITASLNLLDESKKNTKFIPLLRFDPNKIKLSELESILPKFKGVKLHPRSQNFDPLDKKYFKIYAMIEKSGKPLLFHTRKEQIVFSDPDRIVGLAEKFPKLNIILGHFAAASSIAIEKVGSSKNLFLETSVM
ncbi:MAG: amidohydrolase family protein, partial [Nanoarchaeota archaeon]